MANRSYDWFRQSQADLRHAKNALEDGDFEWSCFAAHQAAEKALKAVFIRHGQDAWGHTLTILISNLPKTAKHPPENLVDFARMLDKFYIPTRYPNGFESGAPTDYYTRDDAQTAILQAGAILEYCRHQID